jgi:hypothetical protein
MTIILGILWCVLLGVLGFKCGGLLADYHARTKPHPLVQALQLGCMLAVLCFGAFFLTLWMFR